MDRFHWLEPLAQVADSVFEWFYFFFISLHFNQIERVIYSGLRWSTWWMIRNCVRESSKMGAWKTASDAKERKKNNLCFLTMKTRHGNRTASMCVYQRNITNGKRAFVFYSLHQLQSTQTEYTKRWFLLQSSGTYSSTARDLISQYESFGKKGMKKIDFCDLSSLWRLKHIVPGDIYECCH